MAKKTPAKRKRTPQRKSTQRRVKLAKRRAYLGYLLTALLVAGFLLRFGYYLGQKSVSTQHLSQTETLTQIFQGVKPARAYDIQYNEAGFGLEGMIEKLQQKKASKEKPKAPESTKTTLQKGKRPKLVIIIDDISQPWQLKAIRALHYHITPSIFPPSGEAEHSQRLAATLKHYMIHLPMQSGNIGMNRMHGTLKVTDSNKVMQARAKEIRRLFPKARFVNNHTGSVFTSNYKAMKRMYGYLRKEGFVFVDSRTASTTKVKKIAGEYGDRYIVRDVFIDNTQSVSYIHKQLEKAVKTAQKRGYAIAIGHPHKSTFKALASAKEILKGVDVVYIDELYR